MSHGSTEPLHPATLAVVAGRATRTPGAPVSPDLQLTSTFVGKGAPSGEPVYGRSSNATWEALEAVIGQLEGRGVEGGAGGCVSFASGMAGIAAVLDLLEPGGLLVLPAASYNTTVELAQDLHARNRIRFVHADLSGPEGPDVLERVLREHGGAGTAGGLRTLVWVENPSNPLLSVSDVAELSRVAHGRGALVAVDSTFATPLLSRPLLAGADVVVHSATKFLAGHSDVLMGAVVARDAAVAEALRRLRRLTGSVPGPFEAWLTLRGIRTLDVRLERGQRSAAEIARRAAEHPVVQRVRYLGLPDDPGHALAASTLTGFGCVLSLEVARPGAGPGDPARDANDVVGALRLWTPATSLGGVESLAERRRRHANEPDAVPENLLRLSVGLEHVEDLWADLSQALDVLRPESA